LKKFKKFYIEITNVCNLKCDFCSETKRAPEFMEIETFSKILDQIKPFTDYIYLHVKGEPLLHPEIAGFLDLCYEKGIKVNITTNGTLIKEVTDKILMKPALRQVNFSLHSFDGNEARDSKAEYINDIFSFVNQAVARTEVITAFRLWNLDKDKDTTSQRGRNLEILSKIENEFKLPYKIDGSINPTQGIRLAEKVFLNQDYEFKWPALDQDEDFNSGYCYALNTQVAILVDGTVVPCCLDGDGIINLGNILDTPFAKIIEGKRAKKIYQGFSKRVVVEELCRKCGFRKRFDR
jgi:radical SAM protein with 4Fe4S-binding SPASM domain